MGSSPSKRKSEAIPNENNLESAKIIDSVATANPTFKRNAFDHTVKEKVGTAVISPEFQKMIDNVVTIMSALNKVEDFGENDIFSQLNELIKIYYLLSKDRMEELKKICELMIEKGLLSIFVRMWDEFHVDPEEFYADLNCSKFNNLNRIKVIFWNYSDKCVELGKACHKDGKVIERLMKEYTIPQLSVENLKQPRLRHMMKANLGILHNVVRLYSKNRDLIRKDDGIDKILAYEKSTYLIIKAKIFIVLAYCINEEENSKLMTGRSVISFIKDLLKSALESPNHVARTYAFSAEETVAAINKLASNDDNKKTIVDAGILPHLTELLDAKTASEEEHLEAVNCIWALAFHPENKEKIIEEDGLIDSIKSLRSRAECSAKLNKACSSALFVLNLEEPLEELDVSGKNKQNVKKHLMLSYNWEVQQTILQLRDFLKQSGYEVWMDVDKMQDSILSAMADAVENAALIIVAMSDAYKNSNSCRTEAEYAYKRQVQILPLLLQPGYVADGWLGAMVGTKLYVDVSNEAIENKYGDIIQQIKSLTYSQSSNTERSLVPATSKDTAKTIRPVTAYPTTVSRTTSVDGGGISLAKANITCRKWTVEEVTEWIKTTGLKENGYLQDCDGIALSQLCKLLLRCPETYYSLLREELHLNFKEMLLFTDAVEELLFS
uniref:uncharacterized protein LOC120330192 n=1 Tax=Styela clava TaxID=7725 RepID=UPI001939544C|nr:uncharacterized protein LOC120330192 [Styela clava]